jgi:hypothetical protein
MPRRATVIDVPIDGAPIEPVIVPDIDTSGSSGDASGATEPQRETINGFEAVDPGDARGAASDSGTGKRRGRPPGSGATTQKAKGKTDLTVLEDLLYSLHLMAGAICNTPELALDQKESKSLADAASRVAAHYNHNLDPVKLDWARLFIVAGGIYGTRIFAIRARHKTESQAKPGPRVVNFQKSEQKPQAAQTPADLFGLGYSGATPDSYSAVGE